MIYISEKTAINLMDALAEFYGDAYKGEFDFFEMKENMEKFSRITFTHLCEMLNVESIEL